MQAAACSAVERAIKSTVWKVAFQRPSSAPPLCRACVVSPPPRLRHCAGAASPGGPLACCNRWVGVTSGRRQQRCHTQRWPVGRGSGNSPEVPSRLGRAVHWVTSMSDFEYTLAFAHGTPAANTLQERASMKERKKSYAPLDGGGWVGKQCQGIGMNGSRASSQLAAGCRPDP